MSVAEAIISLANAIDEAGALGLEDATLPVAHAVTLRDLAIEASRHPVFGATVLDAGGGLVQLVVDRDTTEYPSVGAAVRVTVAA
jgi:hypothetical protein